LVPFSWHQSFSIIFSPYIGAQIKLIIANSSRNSSILIKLTNTVSNLIFFSQIFELKNNKIITQIPLLRNRPSKPVSARGRGEIKKEKRKCRKK